MPNLDRLASRSTLRLDDTPNATQYLPLPNRVASRRASIVVVHPVPPLSWFVPPAPAVTLVRPACHCPRRFISIHSHEPLRPGTVFTNAYVAAATCGVSRASLLTSRWVSVHYLFASLRRSMDVSAGSCSHFLLYAVGYCLV